MSFTNGVMSLPAFSGGVMSGNMGMPSNGNYSIASPTAPTMPGPSGYSMGSIPYTGSNPANFDDIRSIINRPVGGAGGQLFSQGQSAVNGEIASSPYASILANIQKQGDVNKAAATSAAQALAVKRGYAGSSTEAFGVQQAGALGDQATLDAQNNTLLAQAQQEANLRNLGYGAMFTRANTLDTLQGNQNQLGGQLTSDEIASMRNLGFSNNYLALQRELGQQGLNVAQGNIDANKDIAQQQARNSLIQSGASIAAPYLLSSLMPGGGGPGGFSMGGIPASMGGGGSLAGYAGAPAGASSSLFPGGLGTAGGSGLTGPGGVALAPGAGGFFGSTGMVPGLAALYGGGQLAMGAANFGQNAFSSSGRTAGSAGSVLGSALGAQLNAAKSVFSGGNVIKNVGNKVSSAVSSVGHAVTSVFPF